MENENTESSKLEIIKVLKHVLYNLIVKFIFTLPFLLWKKSTLNLSILKDKGSLELSQSNSKWPFLIWLKVFFFDFYFDALVFLTYIVVAPLMIIIEISEGTDPTSLQTLLGLYFSPIGIVLCRDVLQLSLLPFRKYIDWAKKPAQHLEIDHSGLIKNN